MSDLYAIRTQLEVKLMQNNFRFQIDKMSVSWIDAGFFQHIALISINVRILNVEY